MFSVNYAFLFLVHCHFQLMAESNNHYRRERLNCTRFLPPDLLDELRLQQSPNSSASFPAHSALPHVFPEQSLLQCLKSAPYDRDVSAGIGETGFSLRFVFSLCELLELRFDGTLRLWTQFQLSWYERRLAWTIRPTAGDSKANYSIAGGDEDEEELEEGGNYIQKSEEYAGATNDTDGPSAGISAGARPARGQSAWPKMLMYPSELLWTPVIRVLNCHGASETCYVRPVANSTALLMASGDVTLRVPKLLEFSCNIDLFVSLFDGCFSVE